MFTGIVEAVGRVATARGEGALRELGIEAPAEFLEGLHVGASISVDGACLTPVRVDDLGFTVEAVGTTLGRTIAGRYREGTYVNLERAVAVGDRLDGHIVQGHVDGIGHVIRVRDEEGFRMLEVSVPADVHRSTLLHGSIALNGVSLTVNGLDDESVEVALIPHTWKATNFRYLSPGDPVNVEGDLIGKYVGKLLRRSEDGLRGEDEDAL